MVRNRIRALRERQKLSQSQLGERIGRSKSVVSRLEDGSTALDLEMAQKITGALGATLAEVVGIEPSATGFDEDAAAYTAGPGDPLQSMLGEHRYLLRVTTDAVDGAGIRRGDVVVINDSASACRAVSALAIVHVMRHPSSNGGALSLLRQFVPPRLLITNSSVLNSPSLDLGAGGSTIVGVVESVHRRLSG